jgi:hypothetical protein
MRHRGFAMSFRIGDPHPDPQTFQWESSPQVILKLS